MTASDVAKIENIVRKVAAFVLPPFFNYRVVFFFPTFFYFRRKIAA